MDIRYWPFPILPIEQQTTHNKQVVQFLDCALAAGLRPCEINGSSYGVSSERGRSADIFHRGRNRWWEVVLDAENERVASFYVDGFLPASEAALKWVGGADTHTIMDAIVGNVVESPGIAAASHTEDSK